MRGLGCTPKVHDHSTDSEQSSTRTVHGTDDSSVTSVVRADDGAFVRTDDGSVVRADDGAVVRTNDGSVPRG